MVTEKEYLVLSIMSYYNFDKYDKNIEIDLYKYLTSMKIDEHKWVKFRKLSTIQVKVFLNYFKDELAKWKIIGIYDRRATSKGIKGEKTGFYSIAFTNDEDVVLSFRGSEIFPYEEAYKDFIENNLILGIGKKPKQFVDAVNFFEKIIYKHSINVEKISLTGHSLGGGIAQYVAAYSRKTRGFIPKVVTWNAVGVKRKELFSIEDFINLRETLENENWIKDEWINILETFKTDYYGLLQEYVKKGSLHFEKFVENNQKKDAILKVCLNKISKDYHEQQDVKNKVINVLIKSDAIREKLEVAKKFLEELSNNEVYEERIINYGHSKDVTFNIFEHIGASYVIDDYFKPKHSNKFFNVILDKKKFFSHYHYDDVFLPFFINEGEKKGRFSNELNIESIASNIRYFLYHEEGFSNEVLALYYSLGDISSENVEFIKLQLLIGLKNTKTQTIYKERIREKIEESDLNTILDIWSEAKKRMPSPYIMYDIYDAILY